MDFYFKRLFNSKWRAGGQVSFNQFSKVKLQYPPRVERLQIFAQMQE